MSEAPLLLLSPRYVPDSMLIREAAVAMGWEVERLTGWRPSEEHRGRRVVLYGEPLFAAVVAAALDLLLIEPRFDWLALLPYRYTRREIHAMTLAQARQQQSAAFIKPADDKCFRAAIYASGAGLPAPGILSETTPVLLSEPVAWESEFRCFVRDGVVLAHSLYARDGELAEFEPAGDQEMAAALEFAMALLADPAVSSPPSFVLDVGMIAGRGWGVVEANPSWGAGIYRCDPRRVVDVIARGCLRPSDCQVGDDQWVISRGIEL